MPTVWIDVDDLFEYVGGHRRPSGIQRLAFELYRVLQDKLHSDDRIQFVRQDRLHDTFVTVSWDAVLALFSGLTAESEPLRTVTANHDRWKDPLRGTARSILYRLPPEFRVRIIDIARFQIAALYASFDLLRFLTRAIYRRARGLFKKRKAMDGGPGDSGPARREFVHEVRRGDIILMFGAGWSYPNYAKLIEKLRRSFGVKFGILVYDLIPIRHPEWYDRTLVQVFRDWFNSVLPISDYVFAISDYTAKDTIRFADQTAVSLRREPRSIPIGSGFDTNAPASNLADTAIRDPNGYVLFVSTIEPRKNHILLFRVWQRLLEDLPPSSVPTLVFAGRVGWLMSDFMQQLESADYLNQKIVVLSGTSDAELQSLYRGCLFSVFPSRFEGWGLPVTESLALGKPCIAANNTAIPEAGREFCRYFDADDLTEAYEVIKKTILDKEGLATWEAEIRRNFRPTPWSASANAILAELEMVAVDQKIACPILQMEVTTASTNNRW